MSSGSWEDSWRMWRIGVRWARRYYELYKKPRHYRNQLWMLDDRLHEDASKRSLVRGNLVHGSSESVQERIVHVLEGLLKPGVLVVVFAAYVHPGFEVALETTIY